MQYNLFFQILIMQFTWVITAITPKILVGAAQKPKISLVLTEVTEKEYKESLLIDRLGDDKVSIVEQYAPGQIVTVLFNPRASEYNDKWYCNLSGRRIEASNGSSSAPSKRMEAPSEDMPF